MHKIRYKIFILLLILSLSFNVGIRASAGSINADYDAANSSQSIHFGNWSNASESVHLMKSSSAETQYDDQDFGWTYSSNWKVTSDNSAYQGGFHYSETLKDWATFPFNGTKLKLIYSSNHEYGIVQVLVDDKSIGTLNEAKGKSGQQISWTSPNLGRGSHILKIVHSKGGPVNIDGLLIIDKTNKPATKSTVEATATIASAATPDAANPTDLSLIASPTATSTDAVPPSETEILPSPTPTATLSSPGPVSATQAEGQPMSQGTVVVTATPTGNLATAAAPNRLAGVASPTSARNLLLVTADVTLSVPPTVATTNTPAAISSATPTGTVYYVNSAMGSDSNPGTQAQPWATLRKAIRTLPAGSTLYIRGGDYDAAGAASGGPSVGFRKSGTSAKPITLTNYPGEQAIIHQNGKNAFSCTWFQGVTTSAKIDHIHIIGSDVQPRTLPNGVVSQKGIVIQGESGTTMDAIQSFGGCDNWEIAGIDFIDTGSAIFTEKHNQSQMVDNSPDYWYVHDNRVYRYWTESGMQFNGNNNWIENNEIDKVTNEVTRPYGCQLLNLLGNNNTVRGNTLSRSGSTADCAGLRFEWDLADHNLIDNNTFTDVPWGVFVNGGDGNTIQNNTLIATRGTTGFGIAVTSYDNQTIWPCNDFAGSGSSSEVLLPPNNPAHPDYQYYFPHDCHSKNNSFIGNTITGFSKAWSQYDVIDNTNIFLNNTVKP